MKCNSYYLFFNTISNKTRMNIVDALMKGEKSVGDICEEIKEEQSKVSHNLKRLMDCNFITVKKEGKKRIYSLNQETVVPILKLVDKHVSKYCDKECWQKVRL